jgi:hypothetical protein
MTLITLTAGRGCGIKVGAVPSYPF